MVIQDASSERSEVESQQVNADSRSALWKELLLGGLSPESSESQDTYRALVQMPCVYDDVISRDVDRTLPQVVWQVLVASSRFFGLPWDAFF